MASGDRAASNLKMEKLFADERPSVPRLAGLGCQVHCVNTVSGKVLEISKSIVSGAIALALAESGAGSVVALRSSIAKVLKDAFQTKLLCLSSCTLGLSLDCDNEYMVTAKPKLR